MVKIMKIYSPKKEILLIVFVSIILSLGLCTAALYISNEYFITHAFFYDPVGDFSRTIPFYERMQEEAHLNQIASRINFAKLWFQGDPKSPFLYIPTILLAPKLLATPWSILPAMFFAVSTLLFLLGYSMRMRNHSVLHMVSILVLFCAAPFLLNPERGMAAGWLDLPASFLLTSGILAFLNWRNFQKTYWLILSAGFIAFASMSRSTIIIYAAIILVFPIIISLLEYKKKAIRPLGVYILSVMILSAPFYYYSFMFNYRYYTSLNSGMASSIQESALLFIHTFSIIGCMYILFLVFLILFLVYAYNRSLMFVSKFSVSIYVWMLLILPVIWVLIHKTGNTYHVYLTLFPLLFFPFITISEYRKKGNILLSILIISFASVQIAYSYTSKLYSAKNPSIEAQDTKQLYTQLAQRVTELAPGETWLAYFDDDVTRIANVEAYVQYQYYPKNYARGILYHHHSYWQANYGNMTDIEIADSLCANLQTVAMLVMPLRPQYIDSIVSENYPTTRFVLQRVYEHIQSDTGWELRDSIETIRYKTLGVFMKNAKKNDALSL